MTVTEVIGAIQLAQKGIENAPAIVNAANHIVTHGVKIGGYEVLSKAWQGIAQNSGSLTSAKDIGAAALQGLQGFEGSGSLAKDIMTLGQNVKGRFVPPKASPTVPQLTAKDAFRATDDLSHAATESVSRVSSMVGSVGSAAMKGGAVGIALGITTETLISYERYKNGEITQKEYITEIAKSGAQMGISGAASAGIMAAVSVPLTAAGLAAAPITVPITIILGAGIDKIIAPAFGRGEYAKILGEAKYYQNLLYAHDDLVRAIEMTEREFACFIDEYQQQLAVHAQLLIRIVSFPGFMQSQISSSMHSLRSLRIHSIRLAVFLIKYNSGGMKNGNRSFDGRGYSLSRTAAGLRRQCDARANDYAAAKYHGFAE